MSFGAEIKYYKYFLSSAPNVFKFINAEIKMINIEKYSSEFFTIESYLNILGFCRMKLEPTAKITNIKCLYFS